MTAELRAQIEADALELVREWTQMDGRLVLSGRDLADFRDQLADCISGRASMTAADSAVPVSEPGAKGLVEAVEALLDEHLPGDYTHLFYDDPGMVDPPVDCRCGHRSERGVSHHRHVATLLAAHAPEGAEGEREGSAFNPIRVPVDDFVQRAIAARPAPEADPAAGEPDQREPKRCPKCREWCNYDGWGHVHQNGIGIESCATPDAGDVEALLNEAQGLIVSVGMDPDFGDLHTGLTSRQERASRLVSRAQALVDRLLAATADRARREGAVEAGQRIAQAIERERPIGVSSDFEHGVDGALVKAARIARADRLETP